jgi:hypothetical protein
MRAPPSLLRWCFFSLTFGVLVALLAPGCGRSSLEAESLVDGSIPVPEAGACGPSTCPTGCCDARGTCRTGTDTQACGGAGKQCNDCIANGFTTCESTTKSCSRATATCNASTCPSGCCAVVGGVTQCLSGTEANACGRNGASCAQCAAQGRACDTATRACTSTKCDASNCNGCCVGDTCLPGTDSLSCGEKGQACLSCAAQGRVCRGQAGGGGVCEGTPSCGPANCGGCCNGDTCVAGSDGAACGKGGAACANCVVQGRVCVPQGQPNERTCQVQATCNAGNCPGCCQGNTCIVLTTNLSCGRGGEACRACGGNESCNAGVCTPNPACGPANCAGCCIGNVCAQGNQDTACGLAGIECLNCAGGGNVCQAGRCEAPACGPGNCAGCCRGNTCVLGAQDDACGRGGAACRDCTVGGQVCQGAQCRDRCGPANCAGCCQGAVQCQLGFANNACGSNGAACANCNAQGSTCNTLVSPRVCDNQQNVCPAAYNACPGGTTTPITPSLQNVCPGADLDALAAACAAGPDTVPCIAAFQVLQATNAACATCLVPFNEPFTQLTGLYRCAAPFVTAACNRSTGCASDCADTSCAQCVPANRDQCKDQVNGNGGQCLPFVQQTACVAPALLPGQLCSPATYGAQFGNWLRAVGDHFCGDGP